MRILIDPGHGGRDPGAQGNGLIEKDLTMVLALRTEERLDNYDCHAEIFQDPNVSGLEDMETVIRYANEGGFDFFLSIHINSVDSKEAEGFESYRYPGEDDAVQKVIHAAVADYMRQSGVAVRDMKEANFKVLRETKMPAVLLECGFLSSPSDAEKLRQYKFIDKLANAIAWGLVDAFKLTSKDQTQKLQAEIRRLRQIINNAGGILAAEMHK